MKHTFLIIFLLIFGCNKSTKPISECNNDVCIVAYSGEIEITKSESTITDWMETQQHWEGIFYKDTLSLSIGGTCGDECAFSYTLKLKNNSASLPTFLSFEFQELDAMTGNIYVDNLESGIIEIQDWDNENVYSGKVSGIMSNSDSTNIMFWWEDSG